jgi:1-acyl-sn-glycerol-3-phosphate acyltransferase
MAVAARPTQAMDRIRRQDVPVDRSIAGPATGGSVASAVRGLACRSAGLWRMGRIGIHIVRGLLILHWRFDGLSPAQRHEHIAAWAWRALQLLRVELRRQGELQAGPKLLVANHVSWLDIVVIHALCPQARFVSKHVVGDWPLIGRLVTGAGTLLVDRQRRRDAARALETMVQALKQGETVALFPEGTTSDGAQVLAFRASLLQSAVLSRLPVQPVALRYAEAGQPLSPSVPYVGTTSFVQSLWRICVARQLVATVQLLHAATPPHADRRALAGEMHRRIVHALGEGPERRH